jgi:hypothetical protein
MKKSYGLLMTSVAVWTVGCLLNGCAQDHSTEAVYQTPQPALRAPGAEVMGVSTNSPLQYQWYFNTNGNEARYSVTNVGGTNAALYYQWFKNTNSP